MTDAADYLEQAEKLALQAMDVAADKHADPQALQRAGVMASIAVFMELRAARAAELTGDQTATRLINDRSNLPWTMRANRREIRDKILR